MTEAQATRTGARVTLRPSRRLLADVALLSVTIVWGGTFVMVKDAVASYPVFSFLGLRFLLACVALLPVVLLRRVGSRGGARLVAGRSILLPSLLIGLSLFAGFAFQTLGLQQTTPAKAGFITGLYVVLVPLGSALVLRQAPTRNARLGVGLALAGLALLALRAGLRIAPGDALVFGCALAFAIQILLIGHYAPDFDPWLLTLGQVAVATILCAGVALMTEARLAPSGSVIFAAAFTGLLATAAAFGVQTVAQRFTAPTHTALIFAAEPVFAAIFSFLLIGELLGPRQVVGCGLILAGMLVAELRGEALDEG